MAWFRKLMEGSLSARVRGTRRRAALALAALAPVALVAVLVAAVAPALTATERVPVAVVNLDEGAVDANGREVAYGEDLVDDLADSAELAWDVVDDEAAGAGLADGTYALVLRIPADYSEKVASVAGDAPEQATLEVLSDGSVNVLATDAGSAALKQVQARLKSDLGENYMLSVLSRVRGQASRLTMTADGAVMLDEAYDALAQGADAIAQGLNQISQGTGTLTDGLGTIAQGVTAVGEGTQAVAAGIEQTTRQAVEPLAQASSGLASGLEGVSRGVAYSAQMASAASDALDEGFGDLSGLAGLAPELEEPARSLSQALADSSAALAQIRSGAADVTEGVGAAVDGVAAVERGAASLSAQLDNSSDPSAPGIAQRAAELAAAAKRWQSVDGAQRVADVTAALESLKESASPDEQEAIEDALVLIKEMDGDMGSLADGLAGEDGTGGLAGAARTAAQDASTLSSGAGSASAGLRQANEAASAVNDAAASFDAAGSQAVGALEEAAPTLEDAAQAAYGSLTSMGKAKAILGESDLYGGTDLAGFTGALASQLSAGSSGADVGMTLGTLAAVQAQGMAALPEVLGALSTTTYQLGQGGASLGAVLDASAQGVSALGTGLSSLASAQGQIASGVSQLGDMSGSITDSMSQAGETLADVSSSYADRAEVAASPVRLATTVENRVDDAAALVPACALIALWAGAIASCALLPAADARAVIAGRTASALAAAFAPYALLGLVQAVLVGAACVIAAGAPADPARFAAVLALAALADAAVAFALRQAAGRAAVPAMVALLLVQAVCGGAVLPEVFTQGAFAALGRVLPVPVAARALLGALSGGAGASAAALACLAAWVVAALACAAVAARARLRVRPERVFARA